jgi:NAD(P) transhydrogenase subunit beta
MSDSLGILMDVVVILVLVGGVALFRSPRTARLGNLVAALALTLAIAAVFVRNELGLIGVIIAVLVAGGVVGLVIALRVSMTQIPAMVAFQHGAGGMAALLVAFLEVWRGSITGIPPVQETAGLVGLVIGGATLTGSLVAAGKLSGVLDGRPTYLKGHTFWLMVLLALAAASCVWAGLAAGGAVIIALSIASLCALAAGVVLAIRIGGADMPVLISVLNATAGFAAAFCGVILGSTLLVACGATVAASGSVLTLVMCRAMNRSVVNVVLGSGARTKKGRAVTTVPPAAPSELPVTPEAVEKPVVATTSPAPVGPYAESASALRGAQRVVIIPGYGMAQAQAQFEVVELAKALQGLGKDVKFAVHPVAGRMPGHMHVLLAEANVPYDQLIEIDRINPEFPETDVALVVGACDVVNPAALEKEECPISGMPILRADQAKQVLVCNFDEKPGYSGVDNTLYEREHTVMLAGDAKETVSGLLRALRELAEEAPAA